MYIKIKVNFFPLKHSTLKIYCGGIRICNGWIFVDLMSILIHKLISPTSYQMWSLYIIHIPVSLSTKITHPYEPLKCWQSTKIGINQKFQWFHSIYMYNYFNTQTDKCGIMCLKKKKKWTIITDKHLFVAYVLEIYSWQWIVLQSQF